MPAAAAASRVTCAATLLLSCRGPAVSPNRCASPMRPWARSLSRRFVVVDRGEGLFRLSKEMTALISSNSLQTVLLLLFFACPIENPSQNLVYL